LDWPTAIFWAAWLATLGLTVRFLILIGSWPIGALALVGLALSAQTIRNMPLFFLLSPLIWRPWTLAINKKALRVLNPAMLSILGFALSLSVVTGRYHRWVSALSTFGVHLEWASYPIGVVEFLQKGGFKGKIFSDSYDGGYLEYHMDGIQIAGDSYFSDSLQTRRFFAAIKEPNALMQMIAQFNFDALVVNIENMDVVNMLLSNPDWVTAYADSHRILFVRQITNPLFKGDLSQFNFYHGEDLRHWAYEFGVVSWMALAYQRQLPVLMKKVLTDLAPAQVIPSSAFKIALKYSVDHRDEDLVRLLASLQDRVQ
jgi:hypothetical protein